jgi:hypothetical protein
MTFGAAVRQACNALAAIHPWRFDAARADPIRSRACATIAAAPRPVRAAYRRFARIGDNMNAIKIVAIALIAAGVLGLAYGSFSYTKETHQAKLGPIELSVKEKQTVNVPAWAGVGAIVVGGMLLLFGSKKG